MERLDTSNMTDLVREAFEKWSTDGRRLGGMEREFAWAAWQQSRREALNSVLRGLRSEEQTLQIRAVIASVECMQAEEVGRE